MHCISGLLVTQRNELITNSFKTALCASLSMSYVGVFINAKLSWKKKQQGFTLLEIMVVIVLIGLISSSVLLTLPNKDQIAKTDPNQAAQLAAALRSLSLKATLSQRWYGLYFSSGNYQPVVFVDKQWQSDENTQSKPLPQDSSFTLIVNDKTINTQATHHQEGLEGNIIIEPQVLIAPNGLFNNFEMRFLDQLNEIILRDPYASF